MEIPKDKKLLSVAEASQYAGFAEQTFYDWIYRRKIEYVKISRRVFFKKETLDRLIEENTVKPREVSHD
ncbi:helix-turn-helix domain-containing protein [Seleniivibrio woodruffii]|uniref:Excisionase family DNA binding protein n=1 Tax=Seleniivibrio woodruffii TaxID=1078050 RepID=A0A4V2PRZ1_9BACT|nr:helix-turn-helix domain-containing protein [Seleniivibrio woodruffii]TCK59931.1 excisionase family DNA binding protein [Seleniivibrio woodruffii]TVZ35848.1 excisionase family DNA binding protein [Seleniivibrio woodruffii]